MSERQYLILTETVVRRLADLLAEAARCASEGDEFGSPRFRRRANGLRGSVRLFVECLPSSVALSVSDEIRNWSDEADSGDDRSVGLRHLLRQLDPSCSPKIS